VADDILRGTFKAHEYGDVILPFVVLRRLDLVLEPKKDDVIKQYEQFKDSLDKERLTPILRQAAGGTNFYNHSFSWWCKAFNMSSHRQKTTTICVSMSFSFTVVVGIP
jgi:type I restriction-modification system DNA methylase subunit